MNEDTDFIYDSEAEPNMRTTLPSSPVSELAERLRHRAKTLNGSMVGASDGATYALGYYDQFAAKDDAEAADRLTALEAENARLRYLPTDVIEALLSIGEVEWGATEPQTSGEHIDSLATTLRITREHFNLEDVPVSMHGVYLTGTGIVLCHTGTSPNSGNHARILTGAWNHFLEIARKAALSTAPQGGNHGE